MTLPLALVIRLLSLFLEGENITVYEGRLPETLAELYLPTKTQVAVSFVRQAHKADFFAGIALDTPLTPEAFMTEMSEGLEQNGWKGQAQFPLPEPLLFEPLSSPSLSAMIADNPFSTKVFTKGKYLLTLPYPSAKPGRATEVFVKVEYAEAPLSEEIPLGRLPDLLPLLTAPKGSAFGVGFVSSGEDYVSGSMSVTTELTAGRLAKHFTSQLEAAGWQTSEQLSGEKAALAVLERKDGGQIYDAQLSVFRSAEGYSIRLEASRRSAK